METSTRKSRIAFIGCGAHATGSLYPNLARMTDQIELVAVCDQQPERLAAVARSFGASNAYADIDEMLDKEKIDGVAVIGPPRMHSEVGARVLERGLPILVEKPSAIDANAAAELARIADRNGTFGMVAFMKRFAVGYRMAKHLIEQEKFGGVQMIDAKFSQGEYPSIWGISSPALSFLTGQVVHLFDLVRFFGGDVQSVHSSYREVSPMQFGFLINLTFTSGAIGVLNLNTLEARDPWRDFEEHLVVAGVENLVKVEDMIYLTHRAAQDWVEVPELSIGRLEQTWRPTGPASRPTGELIGYEGELAHFAECALHKTPTSPSLWDGVAAQRLGEAVWQSAQSGNTVEVKHD